MKNRIMIQYIHFTFLKAVSIRKCSSVHTDSCAATMQMTYINMSVYAYSKCSKIRYNTVSIAFDHILGYIRLRFDDEPGTCKIKEL